MILFLKIWQKHITIIDQKRFEIESYFLSWFDDPPEARHK